MLAHLDLVMPPGYRSLSAVQSALPPSYQKVAAAAIERQQQQQSMREQ
eukprot:ctg_4311.g670